MKHTGRGRWQVHGKYSSVLARIGCNVEFDFSNRQAYPVSFDANTI